MYECLRCGYSTKYKHSLISHLKRKNVCNPILLDVDRCVLLDEITSKSKAKSKVIKNKAKSNPIVTQSNPVVTQSNPVVTRHKNNKKKKCFKCQYCSSTFKHKQGKSRHEKHRCKFKPSDTRMQRLEDENALLKNELLNVKTIIENTAEKTMNHITNVNNVHNVNSNNTTYNTVNVNVNKIGNENIEYLKSFIRKNISDIIQCKAEFFIEFIKQKHFHPKHIENHNVLSFNHRSNSLYAYTKYDTHLERRLKNSISLILYKNIIDDASKFLEKLSIDKQNRAKPKISRAFDRLDMELDAVSDYERGIKDGYDEDEVRENIRRVGGHLSEIQNTIYNESKKQYVNIRDYYEKHKKKD